MASSFLSYVERGAGMVLTLLQIHAIEIYPQFSSIFSSVPHPPHLDVKKLYNPPTGCLVYELLVMRESFSCSGGKEVCLSALAIV